MGGASPYGLGLGLGDELRLPAHGDGDVAPDDGLDNNNSVATNNNYRLALLGPASYDSGGSSLDGSTASSGSGCGSVGSGGGLSPAPAPVPAPAPAPAPPPVREPRVSSSTPLVFKSSMISNGSLHKCLDCDKVFNKACYLTQHNKSFHAGEKPFKCKRCGKRFPAEPLYAEHCSKHAGDKPHKCSLCPKQFNHKTDLRRHICLHTGDKPFACGVCGKGFIRKDHMLKHCETHRKKLMQTQPAAQAQAHIPRAAAPLGV
ncbi:Adult enhancer factor 1 [Gryllus bimaculatus]|nr:Adult enhancer factor 1 [Gryllus bimaculatus]